MSGLGDAEKKLVQRQLRELPPRVKAAQEKEMGEMMGKLKEVSGFPRVISICACVTFY